MRSTERPVCSGLTDSKSARRCRGGSDVVALNRHRCGRMTRPYIYSKADATVRTQTAGECKRNCWPPAGGSGNQNCRRFGLYGLLRPRKRRRSVDSQKISDRAMTSLFGVSSLCRNGHGSLSRNEQSEYIVSGQSSEGASRRDELLKILCRAENVFFQERGSTSNVPLLAKLHEFAVFFLGFFKAPLSKR